MLGNLHVFFASAFLSSKLTFSQISFRNTYHKSVKFELAGNALTISLNNRISTVYGSKCRNKVKGDNQLVNYYYLQHSPFTIHLIKTHVWI